MIVEEEKFEEIHYIDRGEYIEIVATWLNWHLIFFVGFTTFWFVFGAEHYKRLWAAVNAGQMLTFENIIFIMVGVILVGAVVMRIVNKTYIFITPEKLIVRHRPVPWFGNHEVDIDSIQQLYTFERVRRGKNGSRTITYEVYVKSKTHSTDIKIVTGLLKEEQGKFIERKIESWLGIKNMPVRERRALTDHF